MENLVFWKAFVAGLSATLGGWLIKELGSWIIRRLPNGKAKRILGKELW
ncbi:hypothetical protein [Methylocaldum gracile]|jgi:hypothetical protein